MNQVQCMHLVWCFQEFQKEFSMEVKMKIEKGISIQLSNI